MSNFPNQDTVYLEGNPVKMVSLLTGAATPQNSPKVIAGSVREQIILCDPLTGLPLDLEAGGGGGASPSTTISPAASGTGAVGTGTTYARNDHVHPVGGGVPTTVATGHTFANADNGESAVASGTPAWSLSTGLMAGWGISVKGAFTLTAGAGLLSIGAGVTDLRTTTGTAWCCIQQTDTAGTGLTYDLVGTK